MAAGITPGIWSLSEMMEEIASYGVEGKEGA
jgi:hypothetical protein